MLFALASSEIYRLLVYVINVCKTVLAAFAAKSKEDSVAVDNVIISRRATLWLRFSYARSEFCEKYYVEFAFECSLRRNVSAQFVRNDRKP
jgi:hypothetical protein